VSRLSIVIPCLGGAAEFDATLVSVLQHRPDDCEVIVLHTEAYDDPYDLGGEVRFIECRSASLVELLNIGIEQSSGDVLHILGCGLEATEHWAEPVLAHFDDPEIAAVSPIVLGADGESLVGAGVAWSLGGARRVIRDRRVISAGSGRQRAKILGPTLSAAFYRREVVAALGGLDASLGDELADVSLALDIRAIGRLHVVEAGSKLIQQNDRLSDHSPGFRRGRATERLFWRHAVARGLPLGISLHACTVAGEMLRQMPKIAAATSLCGRIFALAEMGALERHERRLGTALAELDALAAERKAARKPKAPARRRAA
jgi:glycosyl transferase family 2